MTTLNDPIFHDESAARAHFEALRWPDGVICAHCGGVECSTRLNGKSHRAGLFQCNACREHFSVTVGTVMERSHIPLHKWALGFHLMAASKKGVSAHQLHRTLGIGYKSAWFMAHRIREAMRVEDGEPFGVGGGDVEADETYIGREPGEPKGNRGPSNKLKVLTQIDRATGQGRSFVMDFVTSKTVREVVGAHVSSEARLITDAAHFYLNVGATMAAHASVNHRQAEYVSQTDPSVHTNTVEGFYSVFKRGMKGIYQHCSKRHLGRYVAEFDFRYSNRIALGVDDTDRALRAIAGAFGRRLTYAATIGAV